MGKEEDQGSAASRPFDDVESLLRRPFLGESKSKESSRSVSGIVLPEKKGAVDEVDKRLLSNCQPPYQTENDHSILFKAVVAVSIYFAVGIFACFFARDALFGTKTQSFIDSFYFCVVTLTTVGYGDLVPGTTAGKLFTSLYVFVGFGLVGALVSGAANYIVEMQEKILLRGIRRKEQEKEKEEQEQEQEHELSEEADAQSAAMKVLVSGILVVTLLIVGVVFNIVIEEMTFVDAFYCVCVTVTTLGYGDHSFKTATGRLCGALWMLTSTVCLAQFFLYIAELRTESRQLKLAQWVLHRKTTQTDLQAADLDGDGVVRYCICGHCLPWDVLCRMPPLLDRIAPFECKVRVSVGH